MKTVPPNVKCDCGHTAKHHFQGEGFCCKCGCTWYWPNVRYVKKWTKKAKKLYDSKSNTITNHNSKIENNNASNTKL